MESYLSQRQKLIETAVPGLAAARRLATLTDEALRDLASVSGSVPRRPWALLALGGYGSGALLPDSDLDLLFLCDGPSSEIRPFVEDVLYPLWDAGLCVGHQVRNPREQRVAVRDDLKTLTATLTGRVLAGDAELGWRTLAACAADARKRSRNVIDELLSRPRDGSPFLLEPDLKEGAGGRRDYDEVVWIASVTCGCPRADVSSLVEAALLDGADARILERCASVTAAARWSLQRSGAGNLLSLDFADDIGLDLSLVHHALGQTARVLSAVRRAVARDSGSLLHPTVPAGPDFVRMLFETASSDVADLELAAFSGAFDRVAPEIRPLMTLRRPAIAHTLTVGAHSVHCARNAARILMGSGAARNAPGHVADGVLAASARRVIDREALLLAALLHDTGKTEPGPDHPERGVEPTRAAARRLGLDDATADHAAALVRHHLLLAETASAADLDDPEAIARVAGELGDPALVASLHVLTVADSLATGPGAWSEWHAALLGTLVSRLDAALSPTVDGIGLATDPAEERRFDELASRLAADKRPQAFALEVSPGPIRGSFSAMVAAHDRPGLLATLAGTFALAGFDILGAHSVKGRSGIALDTFIVTSSTLAPITPEMWNRFERTLGSALTGRFAVSVRLSERRRHYAPRVVGSLESRVVGESGRSVLHVRAPDRVGLLHDIARAIADSGLDVSSLTATSRAGWAEDTFRLAITECDTAGAGVLGQLQMRLREL